jgi:uncharacterized protein YcfL
MRSIILILTLLILVSCDPTKLLVIKANKDSSVTLYTNQKILPYYYGEPDKKAVLTVSYTDTTKHDYRVYFYGAGKWTYGELPTLCENIDSIAINGSKKKVVLKSKAEIFNYLRKHRSRFGKHVLTIEAK